MHCASADLVPPTPGMVTEGLRQLCSQQGRPAPFAWHFETEKADEKAVHCSPDLACSLALSHHSQVGFA